MLGNILVLICLGQANTTVDLVEQAAAEFANKNPVAALNLVNKAIAADPKNKRAYVLRASFHEANDAYLDGVRDWSKAIELDPKDGDSYHARGCLNFKAGKIDDSLADFDKFLAVRDTARASHWQRGISCYYAGKFEESKKQFEVYQDFDNADVENAVWRFMCMVRLVGLKKAQKEMLKIGADRRVPMRDIYELYVGQKTPDDVLAAAVQGNLDPATKNRQLFYAHLYLGIWFDLNGEPAKALDHLNRAADERRIGHYMWDVARVHRDRLKAKS